MAKNVEIKAHVQSVEDLLDRISRIADSGPEDFKQEDTFFRCDNGRLKLRAFSNGSGELIFYKREGDEGPRTSHYEIVPTDAVDLLRDTLSRAYGRSGRVRKHRTLYMSGRTRIHVDQVEDLGTFVELEVVLGDSESEDAGVREARELMAKLGIENWTLINCSYVDMLNEKGDL
jgi:predicted adenylyl cyclase CyaB